MTLVAGALTLSILTISVLPKKGLDMRQIITNINRQLTDREGLTFVWKVKVNGENTIIAAFETAHKCNLEDIKDNLNKEAAVETRHEPVITFEELGQGLGVPKTSRITVNRELDRKNLYFIITFADFFGNTTNELLAVWKKSVGDYLAVRGNGRLFRQTYKHVGERKLSSVTNIPDPADFDREINNGPLQQSFGSNIRTTVRGVQLLDDYVTCRNSTGGYY